MRIHEASCGYYIRFSTACVSNAYLPLFPSSRHLKPTRLAIGRPSNTTGKGQSILQSFYIVFTSHLKNTPHSRHCERSEAISQEIYHENSVRDCFVGKNTLLAMTEKYF